MRASITLLGLAAVLSTSVLASPAPVAATTPAPAATAGDWITDPNASTDAPVVPRPSDAPAAAPLAPDAAIGNANVINKCPNVQYVYKCSGTTNGGSGTCTAIHAVQPGDTYSMQYTTQPNNNGQSVKISPQNGEGNKPILQLEYTADSGSLYFDASSVNGNPYGSRGGFTLHSTDGLNKPCPPPSNHAQCPFVFTTPTNGQVFDTTVSQSIGVTLCQS